jgi:hypothetical protein
VNNTRWSLSRLGLVPALLHFGDTHTVKRRYRCQICQHTEDVEQPISAPLLTVCGVSSCASPSLRVVPTWQGFAVLSGGTTGRMVNGEQRFRREEIVRERDGSETVYTNLREMRGRERERAPHPRIAADNVKRAARRLLPHTPQAQYQQAIEASSGRI